MSLGTGALQVSRGPEHFRRSKEVSMATLPAGTTRAKQLPKMLGERTGRHKKKINDSILQNLAESTCGIEISTVLASKYNLKCYDIKLSI